MVSRTLRGPSTNGVLLQMLLCGVSLVRRMVGTLIGVNNFKLRLNSPANFAPNFAQRDTLQHPPWHEPMPKRISIRSQYLAYGDESPPSSCQSGPAAVLLCVRRVTSRRKAACSRPYGDHGARSTASIDGTGPQWRSCCSRCVVCDFSPQGSMFTPTR